MRRKQPKALPRMRSAAACQSARTGAPSQRGGVAGSVEYAACRSCSRMSAERAMQSRSAYQRAAHQPLQPRLSGLDPSIARRKDVVQTRCSDARRSIDGHTIAPSDPHRRAMGEHRALLHRLRAHARSGSAVTVFDGRSHVRRSINGLENDPTQVGIGCCTGFGVMHSSSRSPYRGLAVVPQLPLAAFLCPLARNQACERNICSEALDEGDTLVRVNAYLVTKAVAESPDNQVF
jgi:hypothetical protein